jgi:hypothetical protein
MSKNIMLGLIAVVVIILFGGFYLIGKNVSDSDIATSTPKSADNNTNIVTTTESTAPIVITSSTVSPGNTVAAVIGTINPKGAFTSYWYEYGVNSNLGSKTTTQNIGSGFVSFQAPGYITNLAKNTTYYFKLVAENQYGRVAGNQFSFKTADNLPSPVGSVPTVKTLSASGVSRTIADINGEVTPNKVVTQYWFEYGKTTALGNTSALSSVGDGTAKVSVYIPLADLEPLTTYYFRINAQNQFGTINGSILNFKTTGTVGATAPKVVSQNATDITRSEATLRGTVNPNSAETKYWFEYSTDSLLGSVLPTSTAKISVGSGSGTVSVEANLSNLKSKTIYYFRLVAENSLGTVRGNEMTLKTK